MTKADRNRQLAAANELLLGLSPQQQRAVDLVATGQRDALVAEQVGVSRQTVNAWRNQHPAFRAALHARRREAWDAALDRIRSMLPRALDTLEGALDGPDAARVALGLLRLAGLPRDLGIESVGPFDAEAVMAADAKAQLYCLPAGYVDREVLAERFTGMLGEDDR